MKCVCNAAKKIVCYFSSWSKFRPGDGAFLVNEHADPFLCTHIIYTFAGLDIEGKIVSLDIDTDIRDRKYCSICIKLSWSTAKVFDTIFKE